MSPKVMVRLGRPELNALTDCLAATAQGQSSLSFRFAESVAAGQRIYTCAGPQCAPEAALLHGQVDLVPEETSFEEVYGRWGRTEAPREGDFTVRLLAASTPTQIIEIASEVWNGTRWQAVDAIFLEGMPGARLWLSGSRPADPELPPERVARFTSSFGVEAYQRLRRSTAVVIGAGGTGSVTIPTLARAGVGRIVIVDSDHITPSNLERTHASFPEHVEAETLKAELARDHVRNIDPDIDVIAYEGRLPQPEIVAEVMSADILIGCTDQHTSRITLAEMARRYLVPAIDCGGLIEGANGRVTGQIIQLVVFRPDDPCPVCRGMVDPVRVRQELMSPGERQRIKDAAGDGDVPPEAHEVPQIDTVGYITTVSGTLAAGYAIGMLSGRFDPPFERMQMNLVADCLDVTNRPQGHSPDCNCRMVRGRGDGGAVQAHFAVPDHWKPARLLD
ncbi:ThiF family adenylyltransferase [Roseibium sp.]|uniref:ThiF family adenylyltransferase n=1 Tax=Roseibium sp. TaxID=1936156 RepID=UPI0032672965